MSELEKRVEAIVNSFKNIIAYWSFFEDIYIRKISIESTELIEDLKIKLTIELFNEETSPHCFVIDGDYTVVHFCKDFKQLIMDKYLE